MHAFAAVTVCSLQGYETQGNEHSWFMLISSAFMLNGAETAGQFTIHPWVASSNNQPSTAAQLRRVSHQCQTCMVQSITRLNTSHTHLRRTVQIRSVSCGEAQISIPDLAAAEAPMQPGLLSMCAGDFLEVR